MKFYGVFNPHTQGFVPLGTGSTIHPDKDFVQAVADEQNSAYVPSMQGFTVATITFEGHKA